MRRQSVATSIFSRAVLGRPVDLPASRRQASNRSVIDPSIGTPPWVDRVTAKPLVSAASYHTSRDRLSVPPESARSPDHGQNREQPVTGQDGCRVLRRAMSSHIVGVESSSGRGPNV